MDKKKIITVSIIVVIIAIALYFLFKKPKVKEITASNELPGNFPLKMGSRGPEVGAIQSYLNSKYNAGLKVDNIWGSLTDKAVNDFLKRDNISADLFSKFGLKV